MGKGVLHVTVESCQGIDDDSWFNKADPYAIVTLGSQKHKTPPAKGGGKNPVWNAELQFNVDGETSLDLRVYDSDVGFDDFMGSCTIPLASALSHGSAKETVPLKTKAGKEKGHVNVSLKFGGSSGTTGGHHEGGILGGVLKKKKEKKPKKDGGSSSSSSDSD